VAKPPVELSKGQAPRSADRRRRPPISCRVFCARGGRPRVSGMGRRAPAYAPKDVSGAVGRCSRAGGACPL
jgi:hypothetical protein